LASRVSHSGKATDNSFIESINGKFRAECLNANGFLSLDGARHKSEAWLEKTIKMPVRKSRSATKRRERFIRRRASKAGQGTEEARISRPTRSNIEVKFTRP